MSDEDSVPLVQMYPDAVENTDLNSGSTAGAASYVVVPVGPAVGAVGVGVGVGAGAGGMGAAPAASTYTTTYEAPRDPPPLVYYEGWAGPEGAATGLGYPAPPPPFIVDVLTPRAPPREIERVEDIPDYTVLGIFVMLCCCLPLGILGLYYTNDSKNHKLRNDYNAARQSTKKAKGLLGAGVFFGVCFWVLFSTCFCLWYL